MTISKDKIIKALECCSLIGSESCDDCPLREECEDSPLASVIAERSLEFIKDLLHKNAELTEQRDTFREYACKMHALVENIKIKENEGYEFSVAKHAAEIDMWRVIAAEKQALQDENKRLREDNEELYKEMSERMKEEVRVAKKYTAKLIREGIRETTFNPNNKFDFIYDEIYSVVDKVLEDFNDEKGT